MDLLVKDAQLQLCFFCSQSHMIYSIPDKGTERHSDNSMVVCLIEQGADPNEEDIYGMTPLHFAARGNEVVTRDLLMYSQVNIEV